MPCLPSEIEAALQLFYQHLGDVTIYSLIRQLAAQQDYDAIAIGGIVELDDAKT
jgi:hypothetical protein